MKYILIIAVFFFSCSEAQITPRIAVSNYEEAEQYSTAAQAVFANFTTPTDREKFWIADFVDRQVANGNWPLLLEFQCRAMQTEANALKGWKGVFNATNTGSATHTPGYGFVYNASSTYINTGFIPNTHGGSIYSQDDGGIGVFIKQVTTPAQSGYVFGGFDAATTRRTSLQQTASTSVNIRVNAGTAVNYTTETRLYRGMYTISRVSASQVNIAGNGNQLDQFTSSSQPRTSQPIYEGALNTSGVVSAHLGVDIGAFFVFKAIGFNRPAFYADLVALMYHLENTTYPSWLRVIPFINGQSNAAGQTTDVPSTSELQNPLTDVHMYDGSWPLLEYGVNNGGDNGPASNFGSELTLGKTLRDHYSTEVRIFKHARDGAPVRILNGTPDYNATEVDAGDYYTSLLTYVDNGHNKVRLLDLCPMFVWILIHGEAERGSLENSKNWMGNWTGVQRRLNGSGFDVSYWIVAKVNSGLTFDTSAGIVTDLRDRAEQFVRTDPRRRFIYDMNNLGALNSLDYPHYRGYQYEQLGVDLSNIIIRNILVP